MADTAINIFKTALCLEQHAESARVDATVTSPDLHAPLRMVYFSDPCDMIKRNSMKVYEIFEVAPTNPLARFGTIKNNRNGNTKNK